MGWIFSKLASLFTFCANFCQKLSGPTRSSNKREENKDRLKSLLSQDILAADEQKELTELVSQFEGDVIFLDTPVHSAKEEL